MENTSQFKIEYGKDAYYKKNGTWYKDNQFFAAFEVPSDAVPHRVKQMWGEKFPEGGAGHSRHYSTKQNTVKQPHQEAKEKNVQISQGEPRNSSSSTTTSSFNPSRADKGIVAARKNKMVPPETQIKASESKSIEVVGSGSEQLLRPLKSELRVENSQQAKELFKRLETRQMTINGEETDLKPYEKKKKVQTDDSFRAHAAVQKQIYERIDKLSGKLQKGEMLKKGMKMARIGENENEYQRVVKRLRVKKEHFFEIDQLGKVAKEKDLTVLNLDKFICATDKRRVIYNDKGLCIFCDVHGKVTRHHAEDKDCPFIYCACANCYLVDKLETVKTSGGSG